MKNAEECGLKVRPRGNFIYLFVKPFKPKIQEADCEQYGGIKEKETPAPPGSDPCTWGPSYWCDTVENAAKCGFAVS